MPVLRWPHDHHRDLRARLNAPDPSVEPDQDRHIMTPLTNARSPNAARLRRSSTGKGDPRLKAPLANAHACYADVRAASGCLTVALRPRRRLPHAAPTQPPQRTKPHLPTPLSP